MGRVARTAKVAVQGVFYIAILGLLVSRSFAAPISHDEIQFIAPGQLLGYQGLLPYADYPYTHMPYGTVLYALSALASQYDYLAARLLSALIWFGCILLMIGIIRLLRGAPAAVPPSEPSWIQLGWEMLLVFIFVNHGFMMSIMRTALNHGPATLFTLLAIWFMLRGLHGQMSIARAAAASGACIAVAGLMRFNFASLLLVVAGCWAIYALRIHGAGARKTVLSFLGGALAASVPALALLAAAPRPFYYGNLVYIRLNTIYYEGLLYKYGMTMPQKLDAFAGASLLRPLELLLYAALLTSLILAVFRLVREQSERDVARLAVGGIAVGLALSAFAPTPTLAHYFAGPIPFLFVSLGAFDVQTRWWRTWGRVAGAVGFAAAALMTDGLRSPMAALATLAEPSTWPPVQVHSFALGLRDQVSGGRILTLNPVVPLEAGYEVYPFAATGPFSWRTAPLLTAERRREYGVTSPEELDALLRDKPAAAILTGWEAPNPGFGFQDQGGLERPLDDYASQNGYDPIKLTPPFWTRGLTLWIRP